MAKVCKAIDGFNIVFRAPLSVCYQFMDCLIEEYMSHFRCMVCCCDITGANFRWTLIFLYNHTCLCNKFALYSECIYY